MPQFRFWDKKSDLETEVQTRIETIFGLEYFREKKVLPKDPRKEKQDFYFRFLTPQVKRKIVSFS